MYMYIPCVWHKCDEIEALYKVPKKSHLGQITITMNNDNRSNVCNLILPYPFGRGVPPGQHLAMETQQSSAPTVC